MSAIWRTIRTLWRSPKPWPRGSDDRHQEVGGEELDIMWLIGTGMNCIDDPMAQEQHRDVTNALWRTRHRPQSHPHRRRAAIHRTFDDAPPIVILSTK